jgi:alcohol oxidase
MWQRWNMWIDENSGLRQDVPHRLLFPVLDAANTALQVVTEVRVSRILFDEEKRAIGVEYNPEQQRQSVTVKARRLVILASGALGTPQILERSGVGDQKILSELGIPLISALPGVGANYQDHNVVFYPYKSSASPDETLDGLVSGRLSFEEALKLKGNAAAAATATTATGKYILGWNGLDCVGKLRPSEADVETFPADLKRIWERDFKSYPDRPLMLMSTLALYPGDHSTLSAAAAAVPGQQQYFCCGPYIPYPYSRGSIHITSKFVFDAPRFNCGYFSDPIDLEKLVWGYKIQREIARRMGQFYRGPLREGHPTFPPGSMADHDVVDEMSRKQGFPAVITYSKEDEDAIRSFIRQRVQTAWHSLGTCAMKPRESGGVVDKDLNVYGVKGLKVVGKFEITFPKKSKLEETTERSADFDP